jgi:60 kDa SS-A/Ro ribonucleoprotein
MRLNVQPHPTEFTHEGAPARAMTPLQALRRSVMSCLLWEREAYEDGEEIADRIVRLAGQVPVTDLAQLAIEVRTAGNLRHVPLLLLSVLAERGHGRLVADTIEAVLTRADEPAEFLAIHAARNKVTPHKMKPVITAQMKKGIGRALRKWDEYQLAKWS